MVQISPDRVVWHDTPLRFSTMFEAAMWTMLIDGNLVEGVGLRIEALDGCDEHPRESVQPW
ncbi:hypothetical protein ACFC14_13655 [Microbacterium sp. NPDC055988]|uniref:hypothetical protein n=1 Tax=Microbacterium sp. NPDC055988 TaxID=3345671 RepID=UPI0035DBD89B